MIPVPQCIDKCLSINDPQVSNLNSVQSFKKQLSTQTLHIFKFAGRMIRIVQDSNGTCRAILEGYNRTLRVLKIVYMPSDLKYQSTDQKRDTLNNSTIKLIRRAIEIIPTAKVCTAINIHRIIQRRGIYFQLPKIKTVNQAMGAQETLAIKDHLSRLPFELLAHIIKNVSCTSMIHLSAVSHILYRAAHTFACKLQFLKTNHLSNKELMIGLKAWFRSYSDIQSIEFNNRKVISNQVIKFIARQKQCLKSLDMTGCRTLSDQGLAPVLKLTELSELNLTFCSALTNATSILIAQFQNLNTLSLQGCALINDEGLSSFSNFKNLKKLNLNECKELTDLRMSYIGALSCLVSLELRNCNKITDEGLLCLLNLEYIRHLNLQKCSLLTNAGLITLSKLKTLQSLNLNQCFLITDEGVEKLSVLKYIRSLQLANCSELTDYGMLKLADMSSLESLGLSKCSSITVTGIWVLASLRTLKFLDISNNTQLAHLRKERLKEECPGLIIKG